MLNRQTYVLIGLLVFSGVIFVLHSVAMTYFYYWIFWWYDVMMHFLGGALIGGLVLWSALVAYPNMSRKQLLGTTLVGIALVGVGWEVMEYAGGITRGEAGYVFDTAKDLTMDTLGALLALSFIPSLIRQRLPDNSF